MTETDEVEPLARAVAAEVALTEIYAPGKNRRERTRAAFDQALETVGVPVELRIAVKARAGYLRGGPYAGAKAKWFEGMPPPPKISETKQRLLAIATACGVKTQFLLPKKKGRGKKKDLRQRELRLTGRTD